MCDQNYPVIDVLPQLKILHCAYSTKEYKYKKKKKHACTLNSLKLQKSINKNAMHMPNCSL